MFLVKDKIIFWIGMLKSETKIRNNFKKLLNFNSLSKEWNCGQTLEIFIIFFSIFLKFSKEEVVNINIWSDSKKQIFDEFLRFYNFEQDILYKKEGTWIFKFFKKLS